MERFVEIPENWKWAHLGQLCELVNGDRGRNYPSKDKLSKVGIPFVNAGHLEDNQISTETMNFVDDERFGLLRSGKFGIGDILFCIRGSLGKVALNTRIEKGAIASSLIIVRPHQAIDPRYTLYYLASPVSTNMVERFDNGTAQPNMSGADLGRFEFPVAPYHEQHRIVSKIEALFSELDKGVESLKTAREQLKVYRQAVLKHAFEGKLTAQWREENADKLEPPEKLLARIRKEREARCQQQLTDWRAAVKAWEAKGKEGKKPGKPRTTKQVPFITGEELADLPKLPRQWTWIRPEELAAQEEYAIGIGPFGSNLKVSDYRESGVALIFVRNITRSDFSRELKYIDHEKYLELIAHSVKPLDLLITKMGDPPGDCEIYPESLPEAILTADCLKFRLWEKFADRRFYRNCINSNMVRKQLGLITKGVAQKKISVNRFKTILLPFMCCDEQQVIADYLDKIFSVLEQQEQVIFESLRKAETLRQSILKKAFSGQLVPQDPNDEPASVLLERIKAEKAPQKPKTGKKQGRRKATTG